MLIGFPAPPFQWGNTKADGYDRPFDAEWSALTDDDLAAERLVSLAIASVIPLRFHEVPAADAQVRVARSAVVKRWGYGFHPGFRFRRSGTVWHHPRVSEMASEPGTRAFAHRLHERLHALGLKHAPTSDPWRSVMATDWPEAESYPMAPRPGDVDVLRQVYGR